MYNIGDVILFDDYVARSKAFEKYLLMVLQILDNREKRGFFGTNGNDSAVEELMVGEEIMDNLKKLESIAELENGWNGNGAKAFSYGLISKVRNMLMFLNVQPEVFPTACNSLQLEYDKSDGSHMEIELTEDEEAEVFQIDSVGCEKIISIQANAETINKVVGEFYG